MPDARPPSAPWDFWIDRGGTFTDIVARSPDGEIQTLKTPSRPPGGADPAIAAIRRLLEVGEDEAFPTHRIGAIHIGATVATNALLERAGAKTLFVTTAGFADALIIGDQTRPSLFALDIVKTAPLHAGVVEADERLDCSGAVVRALDGAALAVQLAAARREGFESVAIAFLHADLNPRHETIAADMARAAGFAHVAVSSETSPLPRFIPRAWTTLVDAYLAPPLRAYVNEVVRATGGANLLFMTSGGRLVRADAFRGRDAVLSGPAGGAVGVALTSREAGAAAVIGFDMGGTSTDVCRFAGALEHRESSMVTGVPIRAPMMDIHTVAAGGGSILSFDGLRARVGPVSAGAEPGPAAYGRGGPATVTDANLVLGRIDPAGFPSVFGRDGRSPLDPAASRNALATLAQAMGAGSAEAAADGFLAIAAEQMAAAIRRVSTERGFDPRDHALIAFGGAGGQVACQLAEALGIEEILCPRHASVLSAWGIGHARLGSVRLAGLAQALNEAGFRAADDLRRRLEGEAVVDLAAQGGGGPGVVTTAMLRLHYAESDTTLPLSWADPATLRERFEAAHRVLFGFIETGEPIMIASVEVSARQGEIAIRASVEKSAPAPAPHTPGRVVRAHDLQAPMDGARLIVRDDTQIWLAAGWRATPEADGLIRLRRAAPAGDARANEAPGAVTLELFARRFMVVAEMMGAALERTARSVNIKERLDFSCAVFDAGGALVANAPHMPVHLGSMGASIRAVLDRHPSLRPGEAFALNNPYAGGTHLPDITVVMPVFTGTRAAPAFFVAARGHHADIGGVQPGSMPPFSKTIDEEGVLLDVLPVMREGRFLDEDVLRALASGPWPARAPARNIADLKAQIAACQAGGAALTALCEVHGKTVVDRYMGAVQANAEACVRRAIGRLANGVARVPLDGGGEVSVEIRVDVEAGEAILDFTASSAQLPSNFNAPASIVDAAALYVFRSLVDDDIPLNAGCLAPLNIKVSPVSMLSPRRPGAVVAGNVETSQHIVDALYEALGVMAHSQGSMNNLTFGDEVRQYYETICGGAGATARGAGASAVQTHMTNSRLTDPEILERRFPVRVERFALRPGSGGAGAHPGGDGVVRRLRFLAPLQVALLSTRRDHRPAGIAGGGEALAGRQRLIQVGGESMELSGCFSITVSAGDAIEIETPGGGGYGAAPAGAGSTPTTGTRS
jgi:5-oxoprolinase (ATP-hydrolysing)